jgi:uncharacterized protein YkwD
MRRPIKLALVGSSIVMGVLAGSYILAWYALGNIQRVNPTPARIQEASADATLIQTVNKYRVEFGKPELIEDVGLDKSAQVRADEIARCGRQCFTHERPDGTSWTSTVYSSTTYRVAGENLAECWASNQDVVNAWKHSPKHNENMLGQLNGDDQDWQYIGSGQAWDSNNSCMINVTHYARREQ